ncbi:hypothetical protein TNCV_3353761 [Trichonephila clavipes]|nr:hypothetical protein TNCV_3353761 [Trichonephila clavipes]
MGGHLSLGSLMCIGPLYMVDLQLHQDSNRGHAGLEFVTITTKLTWPHQSCGRNAAYQIIRSSKSSLWSGVKV